MERPGRSPSRMEILDNDTREFAHYMKVNTLDWTTITWYLVILVLVHRN
jgi:hypothetical protein